MIDHFAAAYWERHGESVRVDERRALQAILQCRTESMGGHRYDCNSCGHEHFVWHSCHHRLCPRCGGADTVEWIQRQLGKLLPVPYFMATFTLPGDLRALAKRHPKLIDGFFKDSAQALREILTDPKRCGFNKNGFLGVYQSWSQDLRYHPHIHFIVPAVGLDADGQVKKLKKSNYLVHAQVVADRLRTLLCQRIEDKGWMPRCSLWKLRKTSWIADIKFAGNGQNCLKYLGQYVGRSVIGDSRIVAIEGEFVSIRIKDRDTGKSHCIKIKGVEFIRRYLLHVLPSGFHRVRYRGFLHARGKPTLQLLQLLLDARIIKPRIKPSAPPISCPHCGHAMQRGPHYGRAPPHKRNL